MVSGGVAATGQPGAVLATTDGAASWATSFSFPYAVSSLTSVSCFSPSVCMAAGGLTNATADEGPSRTGGHREIYRRRGDVGHREPSRRRRFPFGHLMCLDIRLRGVRQHSYARYRRHRRDGGRRVNVAEPGRPIGGRGRHPTFVPIDLRLHRRQHRSRVRIVNTTNGGTTWTTETAPSGLSYLSSIACPSVTECTAVGQTNVSAPTPNAAIVATTDGGATWTTEAPPSGVSNLSSIACPTVSACTAIGHVTTPMSAGPLTIISTSDGGATWTTGSFPSSQVSYADDIACASPTTCTVVGEGSASNGPGLALATTDGGSTWTTESTPTAYTYGGISCPADRGMHGGRSVGPSRAERSSSARPRSRPCSFRPTVPRSRAPNSSTRQPPALRAWDRSSSRSAAARSATGSSPAAPAPFGVGSAVGTPPRWPTVPTASRAWPPTPTATP